MAGPVGAAATRIVHIRIATAAIRRRFEEEKPPVLDGEWDEAAYVAERKQLYAQALAGLAGVCGEIAVAPSGAASAAQPEAARSEGSPARVRICPDTGDTIRIGANAGGDPHAADASLIDPAVIGPRSAQGPPVGETGTTIIDAAVQRVLADRNGWRRHLGAGWFERHRAWRARVGSPIQH